MLREIRVHAQGIVAWIVVGALTIVFTVWGIAAELIPNPAQQPVAKAAGVKITKNDLHWAYERLVQQSQIAQAARGIQFPVINEPALRKQALDSIVLETVLTKAAEKEGFYITDEQVDKIITSLPQFIVNGKFSEPLFLQVIGQMAYTPEAFHETLIRQMIITQVKSTLMDSSFVLPFQLEQIVALINQTRDMHYALFNSEIYASEIKLTDEELKSYYKQHQDEFKSDESVLVSYVQMDKSAIESKTGQTVQPSDDQLMVIYNDKKAQFTTPEARSAKHILIAVKQGASAEEDAKAKAKADSIMEQIKKGGSFAELAKTNSDDPGSARQGGELGFFGRGEMVPEFDNAVFNAQPDELIGPIKTQFGYHIVKVEQIKPVAVKPFAEVKPILVKDWEDKHQQSQYEDTLNQIDEMAYENPDSLDKISQTFKLPIQQMTVLANLDKNSGLGKESKVHDAAFSDEVLYSHQNSEVIKVSPDTALVLHVLEHHESNLLPFDQVKDQVKAKLTDERSMKLAMDRANEVIELFNQGKDTAEHLADKYNFSWTRVDALTRQNVVKLPPEVLTAAFSQPLVDNKPIMLGTELPSKGYVLVRVNKVNLGVIDKTFTDQVRATYMKSLQQFFGLRDYNSYVAQAKESAKVEIFEE